jgi:phosphatidylserine decarboxylase
MKLPLAYSGYSYCFASLALSALASWLMGFWSLPFWILAILIVNFFRDPERRSSESTAGILSPADGKIIQISKVESDGQFQGFTEISIFMNLFNVHVNRSPIAGRIESVTHFPGKYLPADHEAASLQNEHVEIAIRSKSVCILVRMVAGLVARRIVPYVSSDQVMARGERIGMIKFGSRVDLLLPADVRIEIGIGDKVLAGITRLASFVNQTQAVNNRE